MKSLPSIFATIITSITICLKNCRGIHNSITIKRTSFYLAIDKVLRMNNFKFTTLICITLATTTALAADEVKNSAAVNKSTCARLANTTQPFVLVLNSGDNLIDSITQCAKEAN